jgi:vacuolar-type H+-ATPase subunit F/Vma7
MAAGRFAAIGERIQVEGFGLAGAAVCPAENPDEVRAAWRSLPADVVVVILTPAAAASVNEIPAGGLPLTVVMPR